MALVAPLLPTGPVAGVLGAQPAAAAETGGTFCARSSIFLSSDRVANNDAVTRFGHPLGPHYTLNGEGGPSFDVRRRNIDVAAPGVLGNDGYDGVLGFSPRTASEEAILVEGPLHASEFSLRRDGSFVYKPVDGYYGSDRFTYLMRNKNSFECSSVAQVYIPADGVPRVHNDAFTVPLPAFPRHFGTLGTGVLLNDENGAYRVSVIASGPGGSTAGPGEPMTTAAGGTVVMQEDGAFAYNHPDPNFAGEDGFSYAMLDDDDRWALGTSNLFSHEPPYPRWAQVFLTVGPRELLLYNDTVRTTKNTPVTITAADLRANDLVPEGTDATTRVATPDVGNFSLYIAPATQWTYVPARDYVGQAVFPYSVEGKTASVTIDVGAPAAPDPLRLYLNQACERDCRPDEGDSDQRVVYEAGRVRLRGAVEALGGQPGTVQVDWGDGTVESYDLACTPGGDCAFVPGRNWDLRASELNAGGACDHTTGGCSLDRLSFDLSHQYPETGERYRSAYYDIVVTASSPGRDAITRSATATVGPMPALDLLHDCSTSSSSPTGFVCRGESTPLTGYANDQAATLRGQLYSHLLSNGHLSIDWGDGESSSVPLGCGADEVCPHDPGELVTCPVGEAFNIPECGYFEVDHTYTTAGTFDVVVQVFDANYPLQALSSATAAATVTQPKPEVQVAASPTPEHRLAPGGAFVYSVAVSNEGVNPVAVTALTDATAGDLLDPDNPDVTANTCAGNTELDRVAPQTTVSCTFTVEVTGEPGERGSVVTVEVHDDHDQTDTDSSATSVLLVDPPEIELSASADPAERMLPGGAFSFDLEVTNTGATPVTLTSLMSTRAGDLFGPGNDDVLANHCVDRAGAQLDPAVTVTCSFTLDITGAAGPYVNDITAVATDEYGYEATDREDATVTITKLPTTLNAEPVSMIRSLLTLRMTYSATLTEALTGSPILGEPVRFTQKGAACTGTTDMLGTATCSVSIVNAIPVAVGDSYTAAYAGNDTYQASSSTTGRGCILRVKRGWKWKWKCGGGDRRGRSL